MSYNENTHDVKQIGLGPGTILIGPYNPTAAGGTPTVSVGAVQDAANINISRSIVQVMQGVPAREVDAFVNAEALDVAFTGIQWNLPMLYRALGGGIEPTTSGSTTTYDFGNDVLMSNLALQYTHRLPNGSTIILNAWKVRGNGSLPISMPSDQIHQMSYSFNVVEGLSDWTNAALAQKAKLFQLLYVDAP